MRLTQSLGVLLLFVATMMNSHLDYLRLILANPGDIEQAEMKAIACLIFGGIALVGGAFTGRN